MRRLLCLAALACLAAMAWGVAYAEAGNAGGEAGRSSTANRSSTADQSSPAGTGEAARLPVIRILYYIRPPYYIEDSSGGVGGLVVSPLLKALALAGWPTRWEVLPAPRQLERIQTNADTTCALGWFKTPQREAFARFSDEIYRDSPVVALARVDAPGLADEMELASLMADQTLTLLVRFSFSYGSFVDGLISRLQPRRIVSDEENIGMLRQLLDGQGDYLLIAPEEAEHIFAMGVFARSEFRIIHFLDAPSGNSRHLMCTLQTPSAFLDRVNLGLQGVPALPSP